MISTCNTNCQDGFSPKQKVYIIFSVLQNRWLSRSIYSNALSFPQSVNTHRYHTL